MPDKRCKHGLTELTCAYCQGYKPPKARKSLREKEFVFMSEKQYNHCFGRSEFRYYNIGGVESRFEES
jgi:hypothetical protein